jgi:hypothetical protein
MKIFDKETEDSHETFKGSFEQMMKVRQANLKDIEKSINDVFKGYSGEMIAVVRVHEDENGEPESSTIFVGGVATYSASMSMMRALSEARETVAEQMANAVIKNPDLLKTMLKDLKKPVKD